MGATFAFPRRFSFRLAGGRNTIFLTSALLIIPAFITGMALQDKATPLWVFQLCAFLSNGRRARRCSSSPSAALIKAGKAASTRAGRWA